MEPPRYVYKYQSPTDQNISNLVQHSFWCSHPSKFNDPFDCAEALLWHRPREVISEIYLDAILNSDPPQLMEHAIELVGAEARRVDPDSFSPAETYISKRIAKCNGVACFSAVRNHLLMWGHYAQGHKGFCLEFDTSFKPFQGKLRHVIYQAKMPQYQATVKELGARGDVTSLLLVKAKEWKYEQEWRLLCPGSDECVDYPIDSLRTVYLGARSSSDTFQQVAAAINSAKTRLVQMKLAENKFKLIEINL